MKHLILTLLTAFGIAGSTKAQTFLDSLQKREAGKGLVKVTQSSEIDSLINGKIIVTKKPIILPEDKKAPSEKEPNEEKETEGNANKDEHKSDISYKTVLPNGGINEKTGEVDRSKKMIQGSRKVQGYRIQVYTGPNNRIGKNGAHEAANKVKSIFPSIDVYPHFQSPRWRCLVGTFHNHGDALQMLNRLKREGFKSASIVKEMIIVR